MAPDVQTPRKAEVIKPQPELGQAFLSDALDRPSPVTVTTPHGLQLSPRRLPRLVIASSLAVVALLVIGSVAVLTLGSSHKTPTYKTIHTALPATSSDNLKLQDVLVNGQLYVNNGVVLKPSSQPSNPSLGQLYINNDSHDLSYFNGSTFVSLKTSASPAETVLGVSNNLLKLGAGLTLNQNTIQNSGVTNLLGTQNQIAVSTATGSVTLGLPGSVSIPGSFTSSSITTGNLVATSITATSLSGNGSNLTNLNASNLSTGIIADTRLSPNVALLAASDQVFHGRRQVFQNTSNDTTAFSIQAADGTKELSIDTINHTVTTGDLLPATPGQAVTGFSRSIVDTSPSGANGVSMALGSDGFGRIAYDKGSSLQFAKCTNANCSTNTITAVENTEAANFTAITMGGDGFARIAYDSDEGLKLVRCTNADCSTSVTTVVDAAAATGNAFISGGSYGIIIAIGKDGNPKIVYANEPSGSWHTFYADCTNADCTSPIIKDIDTNVWGVQVVGMALGSDGFARITYEEGAAPYAFKLARCTDLACTNPVITVLDNNAGGSGNSPGCNGTVIQMAADGYSRILYQDCGSSTNYLHYVQCQNNDCTQRATTQLENAYGTYLGSGMVLGPDGNARITYDDTANKFLQFDLCTNAACSTHITTQLDATTNAAHSGDWPVMGSDGLLRIGYSDGGTTGLKFALLGTKTGQDLVVGTNIGSASAPFGQLNSIRVNTQQLTVQANSSFPGLTVNTTGTGNLLQLQNNGSNVTTVNSTGAATFKNSTDSTAAFQVQNAGGVSLLNVDTTNSGVVIGGGIVALGKTTTGTTPYSVVVSGNYAYVVNYNGNSLQIFNVSNPASPSLVSTTTTGSNPYSVAVSGNYAYVVNLIGQTLQIFNVSNPASPSLISTTNTSGTAYSVTVSGNYAYVVNNNAQTLQIFNVSNPASPSLVGTATTGFSPVSVAVTGIYAYVANNGGSSLQIFNVSNPASPSLISTTNTGNYPQDMVISGSYAYVVNNNAQTLQIFNVSNPASPSLVGTATTGSFPTSVAVNGNNAYVTNRNDNTLQIFNVSNPASPSLIGTATTGSAPYSVTVSGNYVYVVNLGAQTLQIWPAIPTSPTFQVQNGAAVNVFAVSTANNTVGIGTSTLTPNAAGSLTIQGSSAATGPTAIIKGVAGQTADLLQLQNSNGTVLAHFNSSGYLAVDSANVSIRNDNAAAFSAIQTTGTQTLEIQGSQQGATGSLRLGNPTGGVSTQGLLSAVSGIVLPTTINSPIYGYDGTNGSTWGISGVGYAVFGTVNPTNTSTTALTVQTRAASHIGQIIRASAAQTADLFQLQNTSGTVLDKFDASGNLTVNGNALYKNASNSTTAFQIQNSSGTALLTADTTNMTLTVQTLVINTTLTVNGHIITGGTTPGIVAGANAGTGATVSITGNDESGTITVNTGTAPTVGTLATITFAGAYGAVPHVVLTPTSSATSATLQYYTSIVTDHFDLRTGTVPTATATFKYDYHVQQ